MKTLEESNWLKKRIEEYKELNKLGRLNPVETKRRIEILSLRLEKLNSKGF